MSLPPITIPLLDPAVAVDANNDLLVIRQGAQDRKITPAALNTIAFGTLNPLPTQGLLPSDRVLVGRLVSGTYVNYAASGSTIGFPTGTQMWFYNVSTPPSGWTLVAGTGDRVLGTITTTGLWNGVGLRGTWQQQDVSGVPGQGLNINQIPNHQHNIDNGRSNVSLNPNSLEGTQTKTDVFISGGIIGSTNALGACLPHNHGSGWRPAGALGVIGMKD